jgi:hypothetical protein
LDEGLWHDVALTSIMAAKPEIGNASAKAGIYQ